MLDYFIPRYALRVISGDISIYDVPEFFRDEVWKLIDGKEQTSDRED